METIEGKYFENVINKLQKAKADELIFPRESFVAGLRTSLLDRAAAPSEKLDWSDVVLRWRYALGAVPVLAVLAIVVLNISNTPVSPLIPPLEPMTSQIQSVSVPQASVYSLSIGGNEAMSDSAGALYSRKAQNFEIVTFSSASVMPPADVLARARASEDEPRGVSRVYGFYRFFDENLIMALLSCIEQAERYEEVNHNLREE